MPPKITISLPVYNGEKYVDRAIRSVLSQTFRDFELIAVDDGSTDGSLKKLLAYRDPRFRFLRHSENRGVSAALNTVIERAAGEYIFFLDIDDEMRPDALETLCRGMPADWIVSSVRAVYPTAQEQATGRQNFLCKKEGLLNLTPESPLFMVGLTHGKLYKTEVIRRHGIRFPLGLRFEDMFFHYAYASHVRQAFFMKDITYEYYQTEGSIMDRTRHHEEGFAVHYLRSFEALCVFFEKEGRLRELDKTLTVLAAVAYKSAIGCCQPWEAPHLLSELIRILRRYDLSCSCSDTMKAVKDGSFAFPWLMASSDQVVQGFRL